MSLYSLVLIAVTLFPCMCFLKGVSQSNLYGAWNRLSSCAVSGVDVRTKWNPRSVKVENSGSAHNAYIMRRSRVPQMMLRLHNERACLFGDSGYPNMPWLVTPLRNPRTAADHRYNNAHGQTRRVIERTFGLLKSRFRSLDKTGGSLPYAPEKVCQIFLVCCMLHNMAVQKAVPHILDPDEQEHPPVEDQGLGHEAREEEEDIRSQLIRNFS